METDRIYQFIECFISECNEGKEPLSRYQVGLLEKVAMDNFNINTDIELKYSYNNSNNKRIDTIALKNIAASKRYKRPQRLINSIKEYIHGKKANDLIDITDGDALELYSFIAKEINHRNISELKKRNKIPNGFGLSALKTLHDYLKLKGLIDDAQILPREPRHQIY